MKKTELIEEISKATSLSRSDAKNSIDIILEEISKAIISGKGVEIRGFGGFKKRHRKGRIGINPKTGQKVNVPEKFVPHFKPGKELKIKVDK